MDFESIPDPWASQLSLFQLSIFHVRQLVSYCTSRGCYLLSLVGTTIFGALTVQGAGLFSSPHIGTLAHNTHPKNNPAWPPHIGKMKVPSHISQVAQNTFAQATGWRP